jgi:ubiquinone/menaquinone biosynthesis C-methylase UbiE
MQTNDAAPRANWYERYLLPYMTDCICGTGSLRRQRQKLIPLARGQVLEIGIGTGRNLEHYDCGRVERIVGLDPGLEMHRLARLRIARLPLPVEMVGLSAERIPFAAASFDSVVITYSLCTIPDPAAALAEMRRVLKPDGALLFCEHGLAPDEDVRRWQHRLTPLWSKLAGGCRLNRDVPALLAASGFLTIDLQTEYLSGPRPLTFHYRGTARAI